MQLEGAGIKPWTPPSAARAEAGLSQHPLSPHGAPGMLLPPTLQQGFPGMAAHGAPLPQLQQQQQVQHPQYMQQAQHAQHAQQLQAQQQPVMVHDTSAGPQPSQAEEHLTGKLLQLLPHGEENAIAVTQAFEQTVQVRLPLLMSCALDIKSSILDLDPKSPA